ncbi:hypothetical protein D3C71_1944850 [compost metagenome]
MFLVIGLDLANKVRLPGLQCANTYAVFAGHDHLDTVQIGAPLLRQPGRAPAVIFAHAEIHFAPQRFGTDHEWAGADDMARVTQFVIITV